jgi:predicted dienelactone hydrolase
MGGALTEPVGYMRGVLDNRPNDVAHVVRALSEEAHEGLPSVIPDRGGLLGHSRGGWTSLAAVPRVEPCAVVALCPPGGRESRVGEHVSGPLDLSWHRVGPVLVLASGRDAIVPIDTVRELFGRITTAKRMVVLRDAAHFHFCDAPAQVHEWFRMLPANSFLPHENMVPFAELCPGEHAHYLAQSACLAHFDAFLRDNADAKGFLAHEELTYALSKREINAELL